jgi:hypothetical protein
MTTTPATVDPSITREEVLRRASALVPVLKERAAAGVELRQPIGST